MKLGQNLAHPFLSKDIIEVRLRRTFYCAHYDQAACIYDALAWS